jgi:GAF domain-containing protein
LAQQQAVARIGQLALTNVTLQELLDEACRVVATELRADFAGILELVPDRSAFVIQAGVGWPDALVGMQRISADEHSQGGYTLRSNRPVIVRDTTRETRFTVHRELRRRGSRVV